MPHNDSFDPPARFARRRLLAGGAGGLLLAVAQAAGASQAKPGATPIEVWKSPTCGCCQDWIHHLEANGFTATVRDVGNAAARSRLGIAARYGSCHTALVGGYAIEGHVPAEDIRRLLATRPAAIGLAVPGMPVGSPGMDGAIYGGRRDPYDVLLLARGGEASVFKAYR
jgi:hypothetical protein